MSYLDVPLFLRREDDAPPLKSVAHSNEQKLFELLKTQTFDGHFPASEALAQWLGLSVEQQTERIVALYGAEGLTAVVVMLLDLRAEDLRHIWQPAARKAELCFKEKGLAWKFQILDLVMLLAPA